MIRLAMVLALVLTAAIMMRSVARDWQRNPLSTPEVASKKAAPAAEAAPMAKVKAMQPVVPAILPDLKSGYLFNPERMLAGAEPQPAEEPVKQEEVDSNKLGITASIGEVTYAGSIITDAFSRALILYPPAKAAAQPAMSKSSKRKAPAAAAPAGGEEHAQIGVGDILDGYEVAEILPDKLIFKKGEETIEKLLRDPEKKRQAPAPRAMAAPAAAGGPPRPPAMGGGAPGGGPAATGIQSTTIGGAAPPAPAVPPVPGGGTAAGTSAIATPPPPPTPAVTTPPPAAASHQGGHQGTPAATGSAAQSAPVRRMVISRQPSPAPDTSKVTRQSREGEEVTPPPPGVGTPGDAAPAPGGN